MAATYQTSYQKFYRKFPLEKQSPLKPTYPQYDRPPEGGNFREKEVEIKENLAEARRKVLKMHRERYITMYQRDYCKKTFYTDPYDKRVLEKAKIDVLPDRKAPVLPLLPSARHLFGYLNPRYFNTGMTMYQADLCTRGSMLMNLKGHRSQHNCTYY